MSQRKFLKIHQTDENTTYPNLWGTAKVVLRGRTIMLHACIYKKEEFQIKLFFLQVRKRTK